MEHDNVKIDRRIWWIAAGVTAGAIIGVLDLSATEVQGPLLLLMLAAFALSMPRVIAPWMAGLVVPLSMTAVHLVAWLSGGGNSAGLGSIIAVIPSLVAAYGGQLMGILVERAAESLPYGREPITAAQRPGAANLPWYTGRSATRGLLAAILCGTAFIGLPVVYQALLAASQPITWWVATIWQIVTLIGWVILAPFVIRLRGGDETPTADAVATTALQVIVLATVHSIGIVVLTLGLRVPLGASSVATHMAHAFAAYLPLDIITFVLLRALAYVSDADRHLRDAASRSAAHAASLAAELTASRLTALRAQLQPHFLFNAINTAVVLAVKGDASGAASVLTALADLLRYVLIDKAEKVILGDELDFTERYLSVERARFPDRLTFSIEADEAVKGALVPQLILQPLVENALRHGIAARITGGAIRVKAWINRDTVEIAVEDDGAGMPTGNAAEAPSSGPTESDNRSGVGIANTRSRLSLMYGSAATLEVEARRDGGTVSRVTLPLSFATPA